MLLSFTNKAVSRGLLYRCRYRARNTIGWSEYSPVGYLLAASVPQAPAAPVYYAATDSSISLKIEKVVDNGGAPVSEHQLWIDDGARGTYQQVTSYDQSLAFVIDQAVET